MVVSLLKSEIASLAGFWAPERTVRSGAVFLSCVQRFVLVLGIDLLLRSIRRMFSLSAGFVPGWIDFAFVVSCVRRSLR